MLSLVNARINALNLGPAIADWRERTLISSPRPVAFGLSLVSAAALALVLFGSMAQVAARTYNPFIYFRF
jgi:hypothetical protein